MSKKQVKLFPPLRGVYVDLSKVPDPVFAEKMVGDGFAITQNKMDDFTNAGCGIKQAFDVLDVGGFAHNHLSL